MSGEAVRVEGLAALRKDLRTMGPDVVKEVRVVLKEAADEVAGAARPLAHRRTGNLAASFKAGTSGNTAFVRSALPYAAVQEFGGTIRPRGVPITIKANPAVSRALDEKTGRIVDELGGAIDAVARRHGWK